MIRATLQHTFAGISRLIASLMLASACMAAAQTNISVTSTTDGNGLFSYTFDLGTSPYVWGISSNNGDIYMQSHGVLNVFSPPGWTATVDANDFITWQPAGSDTVYVGQPSLTFSVLSSYTGSTLYDQWGVENPDYLKGVIAGSLYNISDHQGVALGYETFSYLGPQVVPEPSAFEFIGFSLLFIKPVRKSVLRALRSARIDTD